MGSRTICLTGVGSLTGICLTDGGAKITVGSSISCAKESATEFRRAVVGFGRSGVFSFSLTNIILCGVVSLMGV